MAIIKSISLALAFILELCLLAALAYWGFKVGSSPLLKVVFGIGAPLLVAIFWGTFLSPKAAVRLSAPLRLALQVVVFVLGALALAAAGQPKLAWALGLVFIINSSLLYVWGQY